MREILFRGKSIVANSPNTPRFWMEGNLFHQTQTSYGETVSCYHILDGNTTNEGPDCGSEVWPETVGQFTGLLDKNNKKIFEGDVLSIIRGDVIKGIMHPKIIELGIVEHCEGKFLMKIKSKHWEISPLKYIEVIGNIHDNPELLEG